MDKNILAAAEGNKYKDGLRSVIINIKQIIPFLGLVTVVLFFQIASGGRLISPANFSVFINHAFTVIIAACGAAFLMSQGNLDFSMAGNVCVTAAITALLSRVSVPLAIAGALFSGSFLGFFNGFAHVVLGLPAFIATLAASFMYSGIANVLLGSGSLAANYSMKRLDNLPLKLVVLIIVLLLTFVVLEFSPFGKQCKAIGAKMEVARQSGVNIRLKKIIPFIICGMACGVIAVFSILRTCTASTQTGASTQINTILALLLGGIPFSGGWASRFRGVIIGSLMMAVIINGLVVIGVAVLAQQVIKGILFVIAVAISFDRKNAMVIK
jgi:ribose transport system permease protein